MKNKKKNIEMNLKKYFGKLKKSNVDEIKNLFKEINNNNLHEIQKYQLYFNEIEFEMEKNKYKQIYLYMDFYKLLINSINKLNAQLINNNISTNVDSNDINTNINLAINNKSKELIKNENMKELNDKKYENQNKKNDEDHNNNIIKNNIKDENISKNNIIEKEIVTKEKPSSKAINQDIDNNNKKKIIKLNKTNIIKKTKSFNELVLISNKNRKRKSFKEFIKNNYEKINEMINEKKNDLNEKNNNNKNIETEFDDDYYETDKRKKNDKNKFDPEKFLSIIGFS